MDYLWYILPVIMLFGYTYFIVSKRYKAHIAYFSKSMGMAYSLFDEPQIYREIRNRNYDIEYMAQYADIICRNNATNLEFLEQQFTDEQLDRDPTSRTLNPTSMGNVAYIIINSPEPYKEKAKIMLDKIIELDKKNY